MCHFSSSSWDDWKFEDPGLWSGRTFLAGHINMEAEWNVELGVNWALIFVRRVSTLLS